MIIKSITLKNFKSFGNNKQTIEFNINIGELILLSGENGAGKSSLQQTIDFSLFGIVRGKNGKRVPQNILPNRINKNLETEIDFINNLSNNIKIQRGLEPNFAKVFINDSDETKRAKTFKKEDLIGFDFDTYKSFISMSVSDFANFIDLNPEEKRNIINKLFNLQDLDNYLLLCNGKIKQFNEEKNKFTNIISTNNQTINTLNQHLISIKRNGVDDKEKEISKLEIEKESKREPYIRLKKEIESYIPKIKDLDNSSQDYENQKNIIYNEIVEIKVNLKNINEKVKVYESGTCPMCDSYLKDNDHIHILNKLISEQSELIDKLHELEIKKDNIILKLTQTSNQKDYLFKQRNDTNTKLNNIIYELKIITKKILELKEVTDNASVFDLTNSINDLKQKNIEYNINIKTLNEDINIYNELKIIFSNKGVRKNIIKNIVKPINVYLKDILDELNSPYNVKIDEEFNVNIYERLLLYVHPESLSMGESKKINIAIALSYLKLMLKFRKLNILFLDEVFSSMDPDNVEYAIKVLKKFTKEFNLNIIILDPKVYLNDNSNFGFTYFDRIIKINKKLSFSIIEE